MTNMEYLKMLVEDFHSATVATIGADIHPQTRNIDISGTPVVINQNHCLHCGRPKTDD